MILSWSCGLSERLRRQPRGGSGSAAEFKVATPKVARGREKKADPNSRSNLRRHTPNIIAIRINTATHLYSLYYM